ncbi:MAG: hypothetical protein ACI9VM_000706 [Candidatus Azotimanducaceae bacterium]|jgi:hypothetical protein
MVNHCKFYFQYFKYVLVGLLGLSLAALLAYYLTAYFYYGCGVIVAIFWFLFFSGICVAGIGLLFKRYLSPDTYYKVYKLLIAFVIILLSLLLAFSVFARSVDKGPAALIKSNLANVRAYAEIYFDGNDGKELGAHLGYLGFCESNSATEAESSILNGQKRFPFRGEVCQGAFWNFVLPGFDTKSYEDIKITPSSVCRDGEDHYVYYAWLYSNSSEQNYTWWCVDADGSSLELKVQPGLDAQSCQNN